MNIYTTFDKQGRAIHFEQLMGLQPLYLNNPDFRVFEGDLRDFYLSDNQLIEKAEFDISNILQNNVIDFGQRELFDMVSINDDQCFLLTDIEDLTLQYIFEEPGEYTFSINFLQYKPKEFTIIIE